MGAHMIQGCSLTVIIGTGLGQHWEPVKMMNMRWCVFAGVRACTHTCACVCVWVLACMCVVKCASTHTCVIHVRPYTTCHHTLSYLYYQLGDIQVKHLMKCLCCHANTVWSDFHGSNKRQDTITLGHSPHTHLKTTHTQKRLVQQDSRLVTVHTDKVS